MARTFLTARWFAAAGVAAMLLGCGPERGIELIYELDPPPRTGMSGNSAAATLQVAEVMGKRLKHDNAGKFDALLPTSQIRVFLPGPPSPAELAALKRRLASVGQFEFRIMASEKFAAHQSIIDDARKLSDSEATVEQSGVAVARWAALNASEFPGDPDPQRRGLVNRTVGGVMQGLVLLNDGFDVTGKYFIEVRGDSLDERSQPQVNFTLDAKGALLFGQLTGNHLPTPTGDRYCLGMVLDGTVLSAPSIESRINDRGRISGSMRPEEVAALAAILTSGPLPSAVKLVSERELK